MSGRLVIFLKMKTRDTVLPAMCEATVGKVGILKIEACINQAVCGSIPNDKYLSKFLYFQLWAMYKYLLSLRAGNNPSQSKIKNIKIPLPFLKAQQIVDEDEESEKQKVSFLLVIGMLKILRS